MSNKSSQTHRNFDARIVVSEVKASDIDEVRATFLATPGYFMKTRSLAILTVSVEG